MAMELITCPAGSPYKTFTGGAVAIRVAAHMGPARGTLSEVVSSDAQSGSYVRETQTISWNGTNYNDVSQYITAADTLVIDLQALPLEEVLYYYCYFTIRVTGTAGATGRQLENFWSYSNPIVNVYAIQGDDWSTSGLIQSLSPIPRNQTQFSLMRLNGLFSGRILDWNDHSGDPSTRYLRVRGFIREAPAAGDIEIQLDQIILLPSYSSPTLAPQGYDANYFVFQPSPTYYPNAYDEQTQEPSLRNGIFTRDLSQPSTAGLLYEIKELQDGLSDTQVEGESGVIPSVIGDAGRSVMHIPVGIVHSPQQDVEDDLFNRTVPAGWGNTPYGFLWRVANWFGLRNNGSSTAVTPGSGTIGPLWDSDIDFPKLSGGMAFGAGAFVFNNNTPTFGPRDFRAEATMSWNKLPETGANIDVGEMGGTTGVQNGGVNGMLTRIHCSPGGALTMYFFRRWYSQSDSFVKPGPPITPYWMNTTSFYSRTAAWPGVTVGSQTVQAVAASPISLGTYTPGDRWHIVYARRGYNLYAKAWKDGTPEPDWQLTERVVVMYLDLSGAHGGPYPDDFDTLASVYPYNDTDPGTTAVSKGDVVEFIWDSLGYPTVLAEVDLPQTGLGNALTFTCNEFKLEYWNTSEDPVDGFLRINEYHSSAIVGPTLNVGHKSQNWVQVADRSWIPQAGLYQFDAYQWNDYNASVLQWMCLGDQFYRRFVSTFRPQIYRRAFG